MFCGKCGAKLRDFAKFCSSCGAPVDQEALEHNITVQVLKSIGVDINNMSDAKTYPGWIIKNNILEIEPVELRMPAGMILAMARGSLEFVCLTPPEMVMGSSYMQASMGENGTVHLEVCMPKAGCNEIYAKDNVDCAAAGDYMSNYMSARTLPYDFKNWERII